MRGGQSSRSIPSRPLSKGPVGRQTTEPYFSATQNRPSGLATWKAQPHYSLLSCGNRVGENLRAGSFFLAAATWMSRWAILSPAQPSSSRRCSGGRTEDLWPALLLLADYFIKGGFDTTPPLREPPPALEEALPDFILRSTTGSSFIDIHHTITLYAIERARHLFSRPEYAHLVASWLDWMGEKKSHEVSTGAPNRRTDTRLWPLL